MCLFFLRGNCRRVRGLCTLRRIKEGTYDGPNAGIQSARKLVVSLIWELRIVAELPGQESNKCCNQSGDRGNDIPINGHIAIMLGPIPWVDRIRAKEGV